MPSGCTLFRPEDKKQQWWRFFCQSLYLMTKESGVDVNHWGFTIVNNTVQSNAPKRDMLVAWQLNPSQVPKGISEPLICLKPDNPISQATKIIETLSCLGAPSTVR